MRADVRYISSIHFWHSSSWEICYMLHESCYYVKLSQVVSLFSKNIHYKFHFGLFWYGGVIIQKKVFLYELPFLVGKNLASLILSCIFWRLIELSYIFNQAVCPFLLFLFLLFCWYWDFKSQITVNSKTRCWWQLRCWFSELPSTTMTIFLAITPMKMEMHFFNLSCNLAWITWSKDHLTYCTHREKAPSNTTPAVTKSMNMDTLVVYTLNQIFITGS